MSLTVNVLAYSLPDLFTARHVNSQKTTNSIGFLMSFRDVFHLSLTVNSLFVCFIANWHLVLGPEAKTN
jgi:hypothetical protein